MEKIVTKSLKVDFHIHSIYSKYKDDLSLVKNGNINNINILLDKLKDNKINMCAITDHDYFSYDMYSSLKSHEKKYGDLIKVFPGVEFSVGLKADDNKTKPVHVICIFDDQDNQKIERISQCIPFVNESVDYGNSNEHYFSEEQFISILRNIDLNVIMIAHQKQSVNSKNAEKSKNDISSLGKVKFNELISCEYFEALEFKNMKNGLFNKNFAIENNKNYDQIRFITGSDCHEWSVYPKHDLHESDDIGFNFTYLKCLPSFRGLAMAFSDMRRISTNDYLFTSRSKMLESIKVSIAENRYDIQLSPGINVIIGDNSIGKSLLLHKLTDYRFLSNQQVKNGYEKYLRENKINVETILDSTKIHTFDYQGSIRDRFTKDNQDNSVFLENKFPKDIDRSQYETIIFSEFEKLYNSLENKFNYDEKYKELNDLMMIDEEVISKNLTAKTFTVNNEAMNKLRRIKDYYSNIIAKIDAGFSCIEDINEQEILINFKNILIELKTKYEKKYEQEKLSHEIKTNIITAIKNFNTEVKNWKTDLENRKNKFEVEDITQLSETIAELVKLENTQASFSFNAKEKIIDPEVLNFGKYSFIKKFKNCEAINNEYFEGVLARVLKKNNKIDTAEITKEELKKIIVNIDDSDESIIDILKNKIEEKVEDDLKSIPAITLNSKDVYSELSNGMNSTIYFDILSEDQKEGIYIVDQPEDDISQNAIKADVLNNFKMMSHNRQIILITHNPQFVVNLDVDNVICLTKNNKGQLIIKSGALEFVDKDNDIDILNSVAQSLDGGIESIQKRWKRYEKTTSFIKTK